MLILLQAIKAEDFKIGLFFGVGIGILFVIFFLIRRKYRKGS
ncbi:hypothetical protein ACFOG5_14920 [Pedobacter fastidiosus]|nr:hypothetical protein [Pedobacter fastidiosus]